ncbi:MAG: YceI family protein [Flavobacteriaceae bacterium]|nr:YceI family protein [Flavobacteriaceae bacterium]
MKTIIPSISFLICLVILLIAPRLEAQKLTENSVKITISGTSTIHEWDMMSTEGSFTGNLQNAKIQDILFVVPVESLVSGKSAMDRNTYVAMNADKYPNIIFQASEIETLNGNTEVKGEITINNITRKVVIPMSVSRDEGDFIIQGFTQFQMHDFNIVPPQFMLGAVKTGEVVSVKFIVSLTRNK